MFKKEKKKKKSVISQWSMADFILNSTFNYLNEFKKHTNLFIYPELLKSQKFIVAHTSLYGLLCYLTSKIKIIFYQLKSAYKY